MPKRMPIQTPASNEATALDDVLEEAPQNRNWTTLFTSMNPLRAKFWKSLDRNGWDTLEGLYEVIRFYREPTKEEWWQDVRKGKEKGKSFEEAQRDAPKFKLQVPTILPVALQIGKEIVFRDETPVLDEVLDYAMKTTGVGALFGDEAAKQEFYKLVEEDPFAFWGWILPIIGQMKKAKFAGTLGKFTRGVGQAAETVDMSFFEGASALTKRLSAYNNLRPPLDRSTVPFKVKHGQNPKTGKALESTVTSEEMAGRAGIGAENVPPINYPKGVEGRDSTVMKQRRGKTEEGIQQKYDEILTNADQRSWSIESFDINKASDAFFDAYELQLYGHPNRFKKVYDTLGPVLDESLKLGDDFELLAKTSALLDELRTTRVSKRVSDVEVEIIDKTLAETFDEIAGAAKDRPLTIADIDALRFRFRRRVKDALQKEGLYETGYSDLVQKVYATLTEDFYNLIENEVRFASHSFPKNFIDEVRQAKADYQRIAALGDSAAAKLIRKHYDAPHKLVTHILNSRSTRKSIEDMKTLLGDEMWGKLQAGFLQRLFEGTGRKKEFTWDGLKRKIESINASDANRLRLIFGDERAKELAEFGEWSAKFAPEAASSKGASMKFINKLIEEDKLPDLLHRLVNIVDLSSATGRGTAPRAVSVTIPAVISLGKHAWQQYLESDDGLEWLREGRHWKVATKADEVITITPDDFVEAIERLKTREQGQVPMDTEKKEKRRRGSIIGGGPPMRLTPFVH